MCQKEVKNVSNISKQAGLSDKDKSFIKLYRQSGGNVEKIANELHLSERQVYNIMNKSVVKERLMKSVYETRQKIEAAAPLLVEKALEMVYNEDTSEKVRATLINSLLDRAGVIAPRENLVQININTEISDRAREILANSIDTEAEVT